MKDIETARAEDLMGVRELNTLLKIRLKKMDAKNFYWNTDAYIGAAIDEKRCFILKNDSMIMGAMIMECRAPDEQYPKPSMAIGTLSVRPEYRGNGLGILLVSYAKAAAGKEKKRLYVESFLEFNQLGFYKRLGFTEAPKKEYHTKPYYVLFIDSSSDASGQA